MEDKINKIMELIIAGIEKGAEVVGKELPGLLEEYIFYYMLEEMPLFSPISIIVCIVLIYVLWKKVYPKVKDDKNMDGFCETMTGVLVLGIIFLLVSFGESAINIAKLKYAPKVYLIEKLRSK